MLLFSLLCITLTLSLKPACAQYAGSGGPGSGGGSGSGGSPGSGGPGSGSGGSGPPGSGGSGSGGGATGSPSWHIKVTSTGTITATGPAGTQTAAWNTPEESAASFIPLQFGQTGKITSAGAYHVVLQWLMPDNSVPTAPGYGSPPKNVLVDTISVMSWGGPTKISSGIADNGLDSPQVISPDGSMQIFYARGEQYKWYDGSSGTITYDIPVSVLVNGTVQDSGGGNLDVDVTRELNVSCNPILLNLLGTIIDPNQNNIDSILIGQHCTAGVTVKTPQASFASFKWTVNGDTFDSFFRSADQTSGHGVYCDPAIWSSPGPGWRWCDTGSAGAQTGDGTVSVSCDVIINGEPIKTITDTRPVTIQAPDSDLKSVIPATSTIFTKGEDGNGSQGGVKAMSPKNEPGITFNGFCSTPAPFAQSGFGKVCYTQIVWLNRHQDLSLYASLYGNTIWSTIYNNALDGEFFFAPPYDANWHSSALGSDSPYTTVDHPEMGFNPGIYRFSVADKFKMYMLYKAPGDGEWVPIWSDTWHWDTSGSRTMYSLQPFAPDPPVGGVTDSGPKPDITFPWWDNVYYGRN